MIVKLTASFLAIAGISTGAILADTYLLAPNESKGLKNSTATDQFKHDLSDAKLQSCLLDGLRKKLPNTQGRLVYASQRWKDYGQFGDMLLFRSRGLSEVHSMSVSYAWTHKNDGDIVLRNHLNMEASSKTSAIGVLPDQISYRYPETINWLGLDPISYSSNNTDRLHLQSSNTIADSKEVKRVQSIHDHMRKTLEACAP